MPVRPALFAAALLVATLPAAAAAAADPAPTGAKVAYRWTEMSVDFGNLHLAANLLGYELAAPTGGPVSTLFGAFELSPHLMVKGVATLPLLGFIGAGESPFRLEAGLSFHGSRMDVEQETLVLEQTTDATHVRTKSMTVPVLNRNSVGVGGGLLFRRSGVESVVDGDERAMRASHLTLWAGVSTLNAAGYSLEAQGYGSFTNHRWTHAGLDLLFDVARTYDADPDADPSRFGGRLWAETIFGRTLGLSGRLEIGYMPGDSGWYMLASLGGGLNLGL